jgi:hypothetical protein
MIPVIATDGLRALAGEYLAVICALPLVIIAEVVVAHRMLKLGAVRAAAALVPANLVSIGVGFPLFWLLLFVLQSAVGGPAPGHRGFLSWVYGVINQVPWLIPNGHRLSWMVPLASLYLLVPAFFASVFVERWICSTLWDDVSKRRLRDYSWYAHFASYGVLFFSVTLYYVIRVKLG